MESQTKLPDASVEPFVHRLSEKFKYRIIGGVLVAPAILIFVAIFVDIHGWIKLFVLVGLIAAFIAFLAGLAFLISSLD